MPPAQRRVGQSPPPVAGHAGPDPPGHIYPSCLRTSWPWASTSGPFWWHCFPASPSPVLPAFPEISSFAILPMGFVPLPVPAVTERGSSGWDSSGAALSPGIIAGMWLGVMQCSRSSGHLSAPTGRCWCWDPQEQCWCPPFGFANSARCEQDRTESFCSSWKSTFGCDGGFVWLSGRNKGLASPWRKIQDFSLAQN